MHTYISEKQNFVIGDLR